MKKKATIIVTSFLLFFASFSTTAQELTADAHTLLLLHFNGNANGAAGEVPVQTANLSYQPGVHGQGAYLGTNNLLEYASAGNIDEQTGTMEFWMKPDWNGNDGLNHSFLNYDGLNGLLFEKDGGNYFTSLFRGVGQLMSVYGYVGNLWSAGDWHHVAISWDANYLKLHFDGQLVGQSTTISPLPPINNANFQIGGKDNERFAETVVDELRISNIVRSAADIYDSFLAGQTVTSLSIEPASANLHPTWRKTPTVTMGTNMGSFAIPSDILGWTSSDPTVAYVASDGKIHALAAGTAVITGSYAGFSDDISVTVADPVLDPVIETIDPFLAAPAVGAMKEIPVVILRFLPTADGMNLDVTKAPAFWSLSPVSLANLKTTIDNFDQRVKFSVEEGTKFRGYNDPGATPYLGYRVVEYITVYEAVPPGKIRGYHNGYPVFIADFHAIFERFNMEHYVNDLGVREIWVWNSEFNADFPSVINNPNIFDPQDFRGGWESNMSSPMAVDISNSNRDNTDLPVYDHTYIVYEQNFRRSQAEAVHNRGHQFEAMLGHVNWLQDGNTDLFWKKFVGQDANSQFITGRCGWTHMPPNTTGNYDYTNTAIVASDIEDWKPNGSGQATLVSVDTWANLNYAWPGASDFSQKTESQWYIYWMQSFPGFNNHIPYGSYEMTNWWEFVADWDQAISNGLGLYQSAPLPIEWMWFRAYPMEAEVQLEWATGSEFNNEGFFIERSKNGTHWETLAFLPARGESTKEQQYSYRDRRPYQGINYYRLRQVDYDGSFDFSEIRSVEFQHKEEALITVFPNPVSDFAFVDLSAAYGKDVRLYLFNSSGQPVMEQHWPSVHSQTQKLDLRLLPEGVYFIQCQWGQEQRMVKILVGRF